MEDYRFSAHFCNQKDRVKSRKILLIQLEFTVLSGGYHSQIESAKIDLNHVSPFGIFFFSFAMCFVSSELDESDQKNGSKQRHMERWPDFKVVKQPDVGNQAAQRHKLKHPKL
jgi:hypothetical protein